MRCKMTKILVVSVLMIVLAVILAGCAQLAVKKYWQPVASDDPSILYSGRIDFTDPLAPRFDWPGILIQANFEGSRIGALIKDGSDDYNVFIDGRQEAVIVTKPGIEEYTLADNLATGAHSIVIARRGEGYQGMTVFKGLLISKDGKMLAPPLRPKKKMEFIGDSITVGFGVEGIGTSCPSEREFKNNWKAFSAASARELGAEYHIEAISGRGMVKNWGEKQKVSAEPLPLYYDRTLQADPSKKWDFSSWVPDIVVINLGTNDYSAQPVPDGDVFKKAYLDLIKKVRGYYPGAWILCCSGPAQQPPFNEYFAGIMDSVNDKKVQRIDLGSLSNEELGCDWHPNEKGAKRITQEFVTQVRSIVKGF
jgi:lysophospholipase L1-like esterase